MDSSRDDRYPQQLGGRHPTVSCNDLMIARYDNRVYEAKALDRIPHTTCAKSQNPTGWASNLLTQAKRMIPSPHDGRQTWMLIPKAKLYADE